MDKRDDYEAWMFMNRPKHDCSFLEAVGRFYGKYAVFSGRASRSEYWFACLFMVLASMVSGLLGAALSEVAAPVMSVFDAALLMFCCASIIPSLAVYARRLHDANMPAWFILPQMLSNIVGIVLSSYFGTKVVMEVATPLGSETLPPSTGSMMMALTIITFVAFNVVPNIAGLVFASLPSNEEGVRFDRNPPDGMRMVSGDDGDAGQANG